MGVRGGRKLAGFHTVAVALVHQEDVAHFNHTSLDALDVVAGPANEGEHEDVDHVSHSDFALPDADSFHQNQIEPSRLAELDGFRSGPVTPPNVPEAEEGLTNASGCMERLCMRVLSPRSEPFVRVEDGSTASTATR